MKCPVCKEIKLELNEIEPHLSALVCANCAGKWISHNDYENWLNSLESISPEIEADENPLTIPQFQLARLCPECRRILVKYKVRSNIPFTIDRCGTCAGIWLDRDEWETLRSRNLHDELPKIFTDHWQEEVSREETRNHLRKIYREKFGADDYEKITEFKKWMDEHEKSGEIIAYLRDSNPLQF